jgi:hypothetical protein
MTTTMDVKPNDDTPEESTDEPAQTESPDDAETDDTTHLNDLPDGAGCAEIWEHLSENRDDE